MKSTNKKGKKSSKILAEPKVATKEALTVHKSKKEIKGSYPRIPLPKTKIELIKVLKTIGFKESDVTRTDKKKGDPRISDIVDFIKLHAITSENIQEPTEKSNKPKQKESKSKTPKTKEKKLKDKPQPNEPNEPKEEKITKKSKEKKEKVAKESKSEDEPKKEKEVIVRPKTKAELIKILKGLGFEEKDVPRLDKKKGAPRIDDIVEFIKSKESIIKEPLITEIKKVKELPQKEIKESSELPKKKPDLIKILKSLGFEEADVPRLDKKKGPPRIDDITEFIKLKRFAPQIKEIAEIPETEIKIKEKVSKPKEETRELKLNIEKNYATDIDNYIYTISETPKVVGKLTKGGKISILTKTDKLKLDELKIPFVEIKDVKKISSALKKSISKKKKKHVEISEEPKEEIIDTKEIINEIEKVVDQKIEEKNELIKEKELVEKQIELVKEEIEVKFNEIATLEELNTLETRKDDLINEVNEKSTQGKELEIKIEEIKILDDKIDDTKEQIQELHEKTENIELLKKETKQQKGEAVADNGGCPEESKSIFKIRPYADTKEEGVDVSNYDWEDISKGIEFESKLSVLDVNGERKIDEISEQQFEKYLKYKSLGGNISNISEIIKETGLDINIIKLISIQYSYLTKKFMKLVEIINLKPKEILKIKEIIETPKKLKGKKKKEKENVVIEESSIPRTELALQISNIKGKRVRRQLEERV